jgi:CRP/FNR family transcriptional regulator, anaerobic regulatory protein
VKTLLIEHLRTEVTNNQKLLDRLLLLFEEKFLPKGSFFLEENKPIRELGLIMEGVMRIYTMDSNGEETNILFITPGHSFSGNFLPFGISHVNIQCITDVHVMVVKTSELTIMMEEFKLLKPFLHKTLNGAHQHILNKLTQYIKLDAKERYLLFLQEYPGLINIIPHFHIANYLGISPTQLSRIRNSLYKKK